MTDIATDASSINPQPPPPNFARIKPVNTGFKPGFRIRAGTRWEAKVTHIVRARGRRGKPWVGEIKLGAVTAYAHVKARSMSEALKAIAPLCRGAVVKLRMHQVVKPT